MSSTDLARMLEVLEQELGPLSPPQRMLLATDGSVTNLLEILSRSPVEVVTRVQEVRPADRLTADLLEIEPGTEVNYRVVELKNGTTNEVLLYAVSSTPLARLEPAFRADLMRADIPIGRILRQHRIEARREILEMRVERAEEGLARTFGICPGEPLLTRRYHIIRQDKPLISIQEVFPSCRFTEHRRVIVEAPSRLHLTLIDMNGSRGRVDGGVGITLASPVTLLEAQVHDEIQVKGGDEASRERVRRVAEAVLKSLGYPLGAAITLHRTIPGHTGLGSGTSLSLATAAALYRLAGRDEAVTTLARITGRGGTSGIGTAAFEHGGFLIDGGHSFGADGVKREFRPSAASRGIDPAPLTVRHPFPVDWKILLATPRIPAGASGGAEVDIFRTSCPIPLPEVQEICHQVLMGMLPALVEHDLDRFGSAVNRIQEIGFKRVEIARQAPVIPQLLASLRDAGAAGAGMSSFGPVVFAITDTGIDDLQRAARAVMSATGGDVVFTGGRNSGALIRKE